MAKNYFVQSMSSGRLKKITYYRKHKAHPLHSESGEFTADAVTAYAKKNHIEESEVETGTYRSHQGVPSGGICEEI